MAKGKTPLRRAIGKLIVELDREYMRAVEDAQPRAWIESSLSKAHGLLSCQTRDDVARIIDPLTITRFFGSVQVASYPQIAAKLADIEELMQQTLAHDTADPLG